MEKRKRGYGFLIFLLLVVIAILGFYFLAPDYLKRDVVTALRMTGDRIIPQLIDAITNPLSSIGASIKEFFTGINFR